MAQNQELLREFGILTLFVGFWFIFVQTNVSPALGSVYLGFITLGGITALADWSFGKKEIRLVNPSNSWIGAITIALFGAVVVTYGGQLVVQLLSSIPISDTLKLLQSTAPAFSQSAIINFITFGVVVAYLETYVLFVVGFDLMASLFKVELSKKGLFSPKIWLIIFGISVLFLFLHITAKGIEDQATLVIVFFMALVSCVLAVWTKEGRTPIIMHILLNSFAMLPTIGINLGI